MTGVFVVCGVLLLIGGGVWGYAMWSARRIGQQIGRSDQ